MLISLIRIMMLNWFSWNKVSTNTISLLKKLKTIRLIQRWAARVLFKSLLLSHCKASWSKDKANSSVLKLLSKTKRLSYIDKAGSQKILTREHKSPRQRMLKLWIITWVRCYVLLKSKMNWTGIIYLPIIAIIEAIRMYWLGLLVHQYKGICWELVERIRLTEDALT